MRRLELLEIHDHPFFPGSLRDLVTDALQVLWRFGNSYGAIVPGLAAALAGVGGSPKRVVDLCSGGGGPWPRLAGQLAERGVETRIRLTDWYPNLGAFEQSAALGEGRIGYSEERVNALAVPTGLEGMRTIFSAFHHFNPAEAEAMLLDAARAGQAFGAFEVAVRRPRTLLVLMATPVLVLLWTPWIRPFSLRRLFWTYVVPVVPFVIWFDGVVSCLRAYSLDELRELAAAAERAVPRYRWSCGEEKAGLLPVVYLLGRPS